MQPLISVSADKYRYVFANILVLFSSEKNLMDSVRDMFSDCFQSGSPLQEPTEELVIWAHFETCPSPSSGNHKTSFFLLLSTNRGFYIWAIAVGFVNYSFMHPLSSTLERPLSYLQELVFTHLGRSFL